MNPASDLVASSQAGPAVLLGEVGVLAVVTALAAATACTGSTVQETGQPPNGPSISTRLSGRAARSGSPAAVHPSARSGN
jgi:hypothetical protein